MIKKIILCYVPIIKKHLEIHWQKPLTYAIVMNCSDKVVNMDNLKSVCLQCLLACLYYMFQDWLSVAFQFSHFLIMSSSKRFRCTFSIVSFTTIFFNIDYEIEIKLTPTLVKKLIAVKVYVSISISPVSTLTIYTVFSPPDSPLTWCPPTTVCTPRASPTQPLSHPTSSRSPHTATLAPSTAREYQ